MPEIMTIEGLSLSGGRTMASYAMPQIEDVGAFSMDDVKEMAVLAGTGMAALFLGDVTKAIPATVPYVQYVRPGVKLAAGVAAFYGLRNWNSDVARISAGVLVGSAIYDLLKPFLGGLPVIGPALNDIVVEDRLLGQLTPEERVYLSEVMEESPALLPPALSEVVEEDLQGLGADDDDMLLDDDDAEEVAMVEGGHGMQGFDASWVGG